MNSLEDSVIVKISIEYKGKRYLVERYCDTGAVLKSDFEKEISESISESSKDIIGMISGKDLGIKFLEI